MKKFAKVMCAVLAVALVTVLFTGCVLTAEKATEKLEKKDYTVVSTTSDNAAAAGLKMLVGLLGAEDIVSGTKTEDGKTESVMIIYFKEKDDAKKMAEDKDALMEKLGVKEDKDNEIVMKQSGNAVVIGTKAAVKLVA